MTPASSEPVSTPTARERGTPPDFHTLYRRYYRLVWWAVQGSGVPEAWVEDVVHDAFLVIHRRREELGGDVPLRPWVIGIARNAAFSHRRSAARRKARQSAAPEPDAPSAVDSVVAYRQAWDQVRGFLSQLDAQQREAFVLCELQGVAPAEVAASLQISRSTVYSRVRLARSKLVDHFAERPRTELPGLLRAARRQGQPAAEHRRRTWALLALRLPLDASPASAGTAGLASWSITGKAALISVGLATAVIGAIAIGGRAGSTRAESPAIATDRSDHDPRGEDHGAPESPVTITIDPKDDAPRAHRSAHAPSPSPSADPASVGRPSRPQPAAAQAGPSLDEDIALLRRATRQLERGEPSTALATLERHAQRHPDSVLGDERLGLRIRALCAQGSTDRAEALAARYVAAHPRTRLAASLAHPCAP